MFCLFKFVNGLIKLFSWFKCPSIRIRLGSCLYLSVQLHGIRLVAIEDEATMMANFKQVGNRGINSPANRFRFTYLHSFT